MFEHENIFQSMPREEIKKLFSEWSAYCNTGALPEDNPFYDLLTRYDKICEGTGIPSRGQMELDFLRAYTKCV